MCFEYLPLLYLLLLPISLVQGLAWINPWGRAGGIVAGVCLATLLPYTLRHGVKPERLVLGMGIAGSGVSLIGLLGMRLPEAKWLPVALFSHLPWSLPISNGFNPNQVGATTMVVTFLCCGLTRTEHRRVARWAISLVVLCLLSIIFLTQSRGAALGTGVGLLFLAADYSLTRRQDLGKQGLTSMLSSRSGQGLFLVILVLLTLLSFNRDALWQTVVRPERFPWQARLEVWQRALWVVRDYPWTGVGLAAFWPATVALYGYQVVPADQNLFHAHNLFLQAAAEQGLPGLLVTVILVGAGGMSWFRLWRRAMNDAYQQIGMAAAAALLAYLIFGLTDLIHPGAWQALFIWGSWGILIGCAEVTIREQTIESHAR